MKQAYSLAHLPIEQSPQPQASPRLTMSGKKIKFNASQKSMSSSGLLNRSLADTNREEPTKFQPLTNRYLSALNIHNHHQPESVNMRKKSTASSTLVSDRNMRNRHIVVMLSLLTISFAVSTMPSSLFYTLIRPMVHDKPYKRLLTNSFTLLRHLSHSFNFIIYFTSSSVIKQQLKEIVANLERSSKSLR
jgi:hypothetical protein